MNTDSTNIQKMLWGTEQEILDTIHTICKENHLRYSLIYGTLIGAVRHKGFIPWDDDIDIVMPRRDYNKFMKIWERESPQGYILQNYYTDSDYTNNFAKVRKDNTTFIQSEDERDKKYHKGIFVDIFPADRLAPTKIGQKIQYIASAVNLLYSKGHPSGTKGVIGVVEKILLLMPATFRPFVRGVSENIMAHWNNKVKTQYFCGCVIASCKKYYSADMFDRLKKIEFNGKYYYSVIDTDAALRVEYDDYMQLPPEVERVWKHHPIVIDFEHNYEDL